MMTIFPLATLTAGLKSGIPELRAWHLVESHLDFMGPAAESMAIIHRGDPEDRLIAAFAYRRTGRGEEIEAEPIALTGCIRGDALIWDVPEGCWRVFFSFSPER